MEFLIKWGGIILALDIVIKMIFGNMIIIPMVFGFLWSFFAIKFLVGISAFFTVVYLVLSHWDEQDAVRRGLAKLGRGK